MKVELVTFYSEGQRLFGNLHLPYNKAPCVITLHGLESSKDSYKWPIMATTLCEAGYACLRFSFRGCGEGVERSEGNFEDVSLTARIKDYKSALQFLEDTNKINMSKLGVIGSSFGGMVAIAAQDKRIKAMVTMGTPYKIPRYEKPQIPREVGEYYILPSGRKFKKNFYEDLKRYDLLQSIRNAPPILILQGSSDEIVPLEHAVKLHEAAPEPKKVEIIENANHIFSNGLDKVIKLSLDWFRKYL